MSLFHRIDHNEAARVDRVLSYKDERRLTVSDLEKINGLREERLERLVVTCDELDRRAGLDYLDRWRREVFQGPISSNIEHVRKVYFAVADKELRKQLIAADREWWVYLWGLKVRQVNEIRAVIWNMERKQYDGFVLPMFLTAGVVWVLERFIDSMRDVVLYGVLFTFLGVGHATKNVLERVRSIAALRESYSRACRENHIVNKFAGTFSSREGETGEIDPVHVRRLEWDRESGKGESDDGGAEASESIHT
jgi:hypothetical protein